MPTVLNEHGFRFFFYSGDRKEPMHIHIEQAERLAKFWLAPVELATNRGFRAHELREIRQIVESKADILKEKWHEHFA